MRVEHIPSSPSAGSKSLYDAGLWPNSSAMLFPAFGILNSDY